MLIVHLPDTLSDVIHVGVQVRAWIRDEYEPDVGVRSVMCTGP